MLLSVSLRPVPGLVASAIPLLGEAPPTGNDGDNGTTCLTFFFFLPEVKGDLGLAGWGVAGFFEVEYLLAISSSSFLSGFDIKTKLATNSVQ